MKSLQIPEYLVVDDRNAMEHEKGLLADAHEAALCFTGGMSYNPHEMALRIRRLIALAMAQQHQIIRLQRADVGRIQGRSLFGCDHPSLVGRDGHKLRRGQGIDLIAGQ